MNKLTLSLGCILSITTVASLTPSAWASSDGWTTDACSNLVTKYFPQGNGGDCVVVTSPVLTFGGDDLTG